MNDTNSIKLELTLPGNLEYLKIALTYIVSCAEIFGFSKPETAQIQLAAEEAIAGIVTKSLNNDPKQTYTINCLRMPTRMEVVIRDKGMPFSPDEIPDYNPAAPTDPDNTDGLSMFLLRSSVDEVHFRNLGRDGKETVLVKNIKSRRIDNIIKKQPQIEATPADATVPSITKWHLRSFLPGDALEISRCAFQAYGYSYESYIYYPERIIEMNRKDELRSVVAVDQDDNLLAHIALKFYHPNDPIAEIGVAFVKPQGRRLNIFSKLCADTYGEAAEQGLQGIYGRAVTSHPLSQKKLFDDDFINCGVLLGLFPNDIEFKELTGKTIQKESSLLMFLPLNSPVKTIYPPAGHKAIIHEIFSHGTIAVVNGDPTQVNSATESELLPFPKLKFSYSRMEVFNTADLFCYVSDITLIDDIIRAKKSLCLERTDMLYLFLDLENPGCPELAQACEKLGFFFAGVLPYGLHGRHTLILQYLNNLAIDYDKIKLHAPFAHKLLGYVKESEERNSA
ncbi:MAG: ATP-binding protein [Deltaproteobacteria bacterium]|nr:ATP-binding protein [Candidatus Tharpella sp.]